MGKQREAHFIMHKLHLNRLTALVYVEKCSKKSNVGDLLLSTTTNLPFMFSLHLNPLFNSILYYTVLCIHEYATCILKSSGQCCDSMVSGGCWKCDECRGGNAWEFKEAYDTHCQLTFRGLIEIKMQHREWNTSFWLRNSNNCIFPSPTIPINKWAN